MYRHQGYNYVGIPAFVDYAHIKEHYASIAPIRGRTQETRPLGRRRYSWYEIVENTIATELSPENPLGTFAKSYACKLYSTNVVEWYPNGDIALRVNRWKGPTTMGMLVYSLAQHGTVMSANGKWYFQNKVGQDFVMPTGKGEELLLSADAEGIYRPVHTKQEYAYKAKRKKLNEIRKNYKGFVDYAKGMFSIDNKIVRDYKENDAMCKEIGMDSFNLLGKSYDLPNLNRTKLLQMATQAQASNDLDTMYKLATFCGITFGQYSYSYTNHYVCDSATFVHGFTEVLKYEYAQEVFEAVEQEQGKAFADRNAKYMQ